MRRPRACSCRARSALPTTTAELAELRDLYLNHAQITDAGCAALASALDAGALPALDRLSLEGTPASAAAKATVRRTGVVVLV